MKDKSAISDINKAQSDVKTIKRDKIDGAARIAVLILAIVVFAISLIFAVGDFHGGGVGSATDYDYTYNMLVAKTSYTTTYVSGIKVYALEDANGDALVVSPNNDGLNYYAYYVVPGSTFTLTVVSETRLFSNWLLGASYTAADLNTTESTSTQEHTEELTMPAAASNANPVVFRTSVTAPTESDKGEYMSGAFNISSEAHVIAFMCLLNKSEPDAGWSQAVLDVINEWFSYTHSTYASAGAVYNNSAYYNKIQYGYFKITEAFTITYSNYAGIGHLRSEAFKGVFDGGDISFQIVASKDLGTVHENEEALGFFGFVLGENHKSCVIRRLNIAGSASISSQKNTASTDNTVYVGGVAGYVGTDVILRDITCGVSISGESYHVDMVGGMFAGYIESNIDFNSGVTIVASNPVNTLYSSGSSDLSLGTFVGYAVGNYVNGLYMDFVTLTCIANSVEGGNVCVGGICGTYGLGASDVRFVDVELDCETAFTLRAIGDGVYTSGATSVAYANTASAICGGILGYLYPVGNTIGTLTMVNLTVVANYTSYIEARNIDSESVCSVYAGGRIGIIDKNIPTANLLFKTGEGYGGDNKYEWALDAPLYIRAVQNGLSGVCSDNSAKYYGRAIAGGFVGMGIMNYSGTSVTDRNIIFFNNPDKKINIEAIQSQTSSHIGYNSSATNQTGFSDTGHVCAGMMVGLLNDRNGTATNTYSHEIIIASGVTVRGTREEGSTNYGNINVGGITGFSCGNSFTDITLLANDCKILAESMSHSVCYSVSDETTSNNTVAYAGLNCLFLGGLVGNYMGVSGSFVSMTDCNIAGYVYNQNDPLLYTNAEIGSTGSSLHVEGIQNTISNKANFCDEAYVGGLVGRQMFAHLSGCGFYGYGGEGDGVFLVAHFNPDTVMVGGIVGYTRVAPDDTTNTTIYNCTMINSIVRVDATSVAESGDGSTKDIFAAGIVGAFWIPSGGTGNVTGCTTTDCEIIAYGYGASAQVYVAGIIGGAAWSGTVNITDCIAFNNTMHSKADSQTTTYATKSMAFASGIIGHYLCSGSVSYCGAIDNVIFAESDCNQAAAGILTQYNASSFEGNQVNGNVNNCYSNSLLKINPTYISDTNIGTHTKVYALARYVTGANNYYHLYNADATKFLSATPTTSGTSNYPDSSGTPIRDDHRQINYSAATEVNFNSSGYTNNVSSDTSGIITSNNNVSVPDIINARTSTVMKNSYHLEVINTNTFGTNEKYWSVVNGTNGDYLVSDIGTLDEGSATYLYIWFHPSSTYANASFVPTASNVEAAHANGWYVFTSIYAQRNNVTYSNVDFSGSFADSDDNIIGTETENNVTNVDNITYGNDFEDLYAVINTNTGDANYLSYKDVHIKVHSSQTVLYYYCGYSSLQQLTYILNDPSNVLSSYASIYFNQVSINTEDATVVARYAALTGYSAAQISSGTIKIAQVVISLKLGATKDLISYKNYSGYSTSGTLWSNLSASQKNTANFYTETDQYIFSPYLYFELSTIPANFNITRVYRRYYLNFYVDKNELIGHTLDETTVPANTADNPLGTVALPYQMFNGSYYTIYPLLTSRFAYSWVLNADGLYDKTYVTYTGRQYTNLVDYEYVVNLTDTDDVDTINGAGELKINRNSATLRQIRMTLASDTTQKEDVYYYSSQPFVVTTSINGGYFKGLDVASNEADYIFTLKNLTGFSNNPTELSVDITYASGCSVTITLSRESNALLSSVILTANDEIISSNENSLAAYYFKADYTDNGYIIKVYREPHGSTSTERVPIMYITSADGVITVIVKEGLVGNPFYSGTGNEADTQSIATEMYIYAKFPIEYIITLDLNNDFDQRDSMTDDLRVKTFSIEASEFSFTYTQMFGASTIWGQEINAWINGITDTTSNAYKTETDFYTKYGVKLYGYELDGFFLIRGAGSSDNYGAQISEVTQPITTSNIFYAKWLYQIEYVESPGTEINANFVESYLQTENNIMIPIDTNQGFRFTIDSDAYYVGDVRIAVFSYGYSNVNYVVNDSSAAEAISPAYEVREIKLTKTGSKSYSIARDDITGYLVVITYATNAEFIVGENTVTSALDIIPEDGVYTLWYVANHRHDVSNGNVTFAFAADNANIDKKFYVDLDYALPVGTEIKLFYRDYTNQYVTTENIGYYQITANTFKHTVNGSGDVTNNHIRYVESDGMTGYDEDDIVGYSLLLDDFMLMDYGTGVTTTPQFSGETFAQYVSGTNAKTEFYYFVITPPNGATTFSSDGSSALRSATLGYKYTNQSSDLSWIEQRRVTTIYDIEEIEQYITNNQDQHIADCVSEVTVDYTMYPTRQTYVESTSGANSATVHVTDVKSMVNVGTVANPVYSLMPNDVRHDEKYYILAISALNSSGQPVNLNGATVTIATTTGTVLTTYVLGTNDGSYTTSTANVTDSTASFSVSGDVYYYYIPVTDLVAVDYLIMNGEFIVSVSSLTTKTAAEEAANHYGYLLTGGTYTVDVELLESENQLKPGMGELLGMKAEVELIYNAYPGVWTNNDTVRYVKMGDTVAKPENPAYDGYIFLGWYKQTSYVSGVRTLEATPYDFSTMVTGDITLVARWAAITFGDDGNASTTAGTAADPYQIGNSFSAASQNSDLTISEAEYGVMQLRLLQGLINGDIVHYNGATVTASDFADEHYKLVYNLTVSGTWTPIGSRTQPFVGVFDGDGKKITFAEGTLFTSDTGNDIGLFGWVTSELAEYASAGHTYYLPTVKNLTVGGYIYAPYATCVGAIVGVCADASILNCVSEAVVTGYDKVGGIVGLSVASLVQDCSTQTTYTFESGETLAAASLSSDNKTITYNYAYASGAKISGTKEVGGIVGVADNIYQLIFEGIILSLYDNIIDNCVNNAPVTAYDGDAGGIVACALKAYVFNCANEEETIVTAAAYSGSACVGGISGRIFYGSFCINNINYGTVVGAKSTKDIYVGGIAGRCGEASLLNNVNTGALFGVEKIGIITASITASTHFGYGYAARNGGVYLRATDSPEYVVVSDNDKKLVGGFTNFYDYASQSFYFYNNLSVGDKYMSSYQNNAWADEVFVSVEFADHILEQAYGVTLPQKTTYTDSVLVLLSSGVRWVEDYATVITQLGSTATRCLNNGTIGIRKWTISDTTGNKRIEFGDFAVFSEMIIHAHTVENDTALATMTGTTGGLTIAASTMYQNVTGGSINTVYNYTDGALTSITFTANSHTGFSFAGFYYFNSATDKGLTSISASTSVTLTLTAIANYPGHIVVGIFKQAMGSTFYTLELSSNNNGVTMGVIDDVGGSYYQAGNQVVLSARTGDGYKFTGWFYNSGTAASPTWTLLDSNKYYFYTVSAGNALSGTNIIQLRAFFEVQTYDFELTVTGGGSVSVDVADYNVSGTTVTGTFEAAYVKGTVVIMTAAEYVGSNYFVGWFIGNTLVGESLTYTHNMAYEIFKIEARYDTRVTLTLTTVLGKVTTSPTTSAILFDGQELSNLAYNNNYYTGSKTLPKGSVHILTAKTDAAYTGGYVFVGWYLLVDNGVTKNDLLYTTARTIMITHDTSYTIEARYSNVVVSANNVANGTVDITYGGTTTNIIGGTVGSWSGIIAQSTSVTLTATPAANTAFYGWYNGSGTLLGSNLTYTFTVGTGATVVEARFENFELYVTDTRDGRYATYQTDGGATGTVNASNGSTKFNGFALGTTVQFNRSPTAGGFVGWYINGALYSNTVAFEYTIAEGENVIEARYNNTSVSLNNEEAGYTEVYVNTTALSGTANGDNNPYESYYSSGTVLTLKTYVRTGEGFHGWKITNGTTQTTPAGTGTAYGSSYTIYTTTVTTNGSFLSIECLFDNVTVSISPASAGTATVTYGGTTVTIGEGQTHLTEYSLYVPTGATVTISANATASGYSFAGWYFNGATTAFSTSSPYTYTVVSGANNVQAKFTQGYNLALSVNDTYSGYVGVTGAVTGTVGNTTGGSASGAATASYNAITAGSNISLTANYTLNTRYGNTFVGWYSNGTLLSSASTYTISSLVQDYTIEARFHNTFVYMNNAYSYTTAVTSDGTTLNSTKTLTGTSLTGKAWSGYLANGENISLSLTQTNGNYGTSYVGYFLNGAINGDTATSTSTSYTFTQGTTNTLDHNLIEVRLHNVFIYLNNTSNNYEFDLNYLNTTVATVYRISKNDYDYYDSCYVPTYGENPPVVTVRIESGASARRCNYYVNSDISYTSRTYIQTDSIWSTYDNEVDYTLTSNDAYYYIRIRNN
ncbi:MAG: InlB B-repeat-containing protein [Clostridia bacterium]|nr:InlB B-repeat-containing protein [Clostridia bacterium]